MYLFLVGARLDTGVFEPHFKWFKTRPLRSHVGAFYFMEHIDDNTSVTSGEFSDHLKEFEKIDKMVFDHEEILNRLLAALLNDENLSAYTRDVVEKCFDILHPEN